MGFALGFLAGAIFGVVWGHVWGWFRRWYIYDADLLAFLYPAPKQQKFDFASGRAGRTSRRFAGGVGGGRKTVSPSDNNATGKP